MERQLSWIALLMTAFYSFLASCRAEECGEEQLTRCARPLDKINKNQLGFASNKGELEELCPRLKNSTQCIERYTNRCLNEQQSDQFNMMYREINEAISELCREGSAQDEFLKHAQCMQTVKEYDSCSKKYHDTLGMIKYANGRIPGGPIKSICCAFKEFLECSQHAVRGHCGEETAEYTKKFLKRMSTSLLKLHCQPYGNGQCVGQSGSTALSGYLTFPVTLLLLGRYFT
ncbi:uncharacterized protein LOC107264944 [Cephus cinctus]|uniref:Uncharacterized protein LOC107264944 n=1 Tax=Cephus cinctus TaxID=211228 RepID=A0AAJ7FFI4_CEPCN|nr:uncharacterized protein LOC107264944 [Cephus cinctus]